MSLCQRLGKAPRSSRAQLLELAALALSLGSLASTQRGHLPGGSDLRCSRGSASSTRPGRSSPAPRLELLGLRRQPACLRAQLGEHVAQPLEVRFRLGQLASAWRRRRSWRRTPAASSNSGRRSSGRSASAWSTMPWPMNRNALSARLPASSSSSQVTQPDALAVEQVLVLARAVQPPAELDLAVVERQQPVLVVEHQRHVGHADRPARRRAGEDDVLRAPRAQQPAGLAERPAQRVGEVALAAAVGSDDRADARAELDGRPLGERLEANEAQRAQPCPAGHWSATSRSVRPAPRGRLGLCLAPVATLALTQHLAADEHLDDVMAVVVGALGADQAVVRRPPAPA
jgi:hypothetical protein